MTRWSQSRSDSGYRFTVAARHASRAILLKIVLFEYSQGIISSRKIADFSSENIVCIVLSADSKPHFTTIAHFIILIVFIFRFM